MIVEVKKYDRFLDFMLNQGGRDLTTDEIISSLAAQQFWDDRDDERAKYAWRKSDVLKRMKELPKTDEHGNIIERVHVMRRDEAGRRRDLHVMRLNLTFEDRVQSINRELRLGRHHFAEAERLYHLYLEESPRPQAKRLQRQFQGIFEFAAALQGQEQRV
jgi:hypothetical protein